MRTLIPLAVLLSMVGAAPYALASEIKDQGPELAQDPYHHNTDLTTGRIAGFRSLYGDPDALADQLAPSTSGAKGEKADLPVLNTRSAWSDVRINGVKVGVIGPYDNGTVAGVQAGTYEVSFTLPNGYTWTMEVTAGTAEEAAVAPTPMEEAPAEEVPVGEEAPAEEVPAGEEAPAETVEEEAPTETPVEEVPAEEEVPTPEKEAPATEGEAPAAEKEAPAPK